MRNTLSSLFLLPSSLQLCFPLAEPLWKPAYMEVKNMTCKDQYSTSLLHFLSPPDPETWSRAREAPQIDAMAYRPTTGTGTIPTCFILNNLEHFHQHIKVPNYELLVVTIIWRYLCKSFSKYVRNSFQTALSRRKYCERVMLYAVCLMQVSVLYTNVMSCKQLRKEYNVHML